MFVAGIYFLNGFGLDLEIQTAFWQFFVDLLGALGIEDPNVGSRSHQILFKHYIIASTPHLSIVLSGLCRVCEITLQKKIFELPLA